jgi:hypothetical protein
MVQFKSNAEDDMAKLTGGCGCGAIRYEAGEILYMGNCHCRDCQQATGAGYFASVRVAEAEFALTKGTLRWYVKAADSGTQMHRGFCGDCGSPVLLYLGSKPDLRMLYAGSLDDPSVYRPMREIYTDSAQAWDLLHADVPHFKRMPN